MVGENRRLFHVALRFSACAPDPNLGQVTACTTLVDEELAHLFGAVGRPIVRECVPVNISDVACPAGADKSDRHNGTPYLVPIDEPSPGEGPPMHQQASARPS